MMNTYTLLLLTLLSHFILGCEEPYGNKDTIKNSQSSNGNTAKPAVINKASKTKSKAKKLSSSANKTIKPVQLETIVNSKNSDQNPQPLDLSLELEIKDSINLSSSEKQEYLPDLFTNKKNHTNSTLQVDGVIIKRDEEQADKDRTVDGVGIDFKLSH